MSNETNTNRTQLTDLPVAEQEMTTEEMENVQGGRLPMIRGQYPDRIAPKTGDPLPDIDVSIGKKGGGGAA